MYIIIKLFSTHKLSPFEEEVSPPPYPAQQGNFPAESGYSAQPGYLAQPGYPQQPYNVQPGYPGPQPFTGQPMGYPQPYPVTQQSSTTVVMQVRFLNNIVWVQLRGTLRS